MKVTSSNSAAFYDQLAKNLDSAPKLPLAESRQLRDRLEKLPPGQLRKLSIPLLEQLGVAKELQAQIIFQALALRIPDFDPAKAASHAGEALRKLVAASLEGDDALAQEKRDFLRRFAEETSSGANIKEIFTRAELQRYGFNAPWQSEQHFNLLGAITDPVVRWTGSFDWMELKNRGGEGPTLTFVGKPHNGDYQLSGNGGLYTNVIDYPTASRLLGHIDTILAEPSRADAKGKTALEGIRGRLVSHMEQLASAWAADFDLARAALSDLKSGVGKVNSKLALDDEIEARFRAKGSQLPAVIEDPVLEKDGYYPGSRLDIHSASAPTDEARAITLFRSDERFQISPGADLAGALGGSSVYPERLSLTAAKSLLGMVSRLMQQEKPPADPALRAAQEGQGLTADYDALAALAGVLAARIKALGNHGKALQRLEALSPKIDVQSKSWEAKRAGLELLAKDPTIRQALADAGSVLVASAGHAADRGDYSLNLFLGGRGLEVGGYFMGHSVTHYDYEGHSTGRTAYGGPIASEPATFQDGAFDPHHLNAKIWGKISMPDVLKAIREALELGA